MEEIKIATSNITIKAKGKDVMSRAFVLLRESEKLMCVPDAAKRQQVGKGCCRKIAVHDPQIFIEDLENAKIGDYIMIKLTDDRVARFDITDMEEDWIRFDSHDCLGETPWNKEVGNAGGVYASDAQKYIDKELWPLFPKYIQDQIIDSSRPYMESGDEDAKEELFLTKLFLPDASELFERDDSWFAPLYEQLDYYKDRRNRMKATEPGGKNMATWWTASAGSGNSTYCVAVGTYGYSRYYNASNALRVPVCFRTNRAKCG